MPMGLVGISILWMLWKVFGVVIMIPFADYKEARFLEYGLNTAV